MARKKQFFVSKKATIILLIGSFLCLAIGAKMNVEGQNLTSTGNQEKEIAIMTMKGELTPFEVDTQKPFDVQMGGIHFIVTTDELRNGYDFRKLVSINNADYPFQISYNNGKLLVSAEIKNSEGEVIATIGNNNWGVSGSRVVAYDRNYNSYAFEVIDPNQIPVLQVEMTPQNRIFVGGVFYSANTTFLNMLNGTTVAGMNYEKIANDIKNYNQTIFQYPSEKNLGVMVNPSYYSETPLLEANRKITDGNNLQVAGTVLIGASGAFGIGSFIEVYVLLTKRDEHRDKGKVGVNKIPIDAEKKKETKESQGKQRQYYELRRKDKKKRKRRRAEKK